MAHALSTEDLLTTIADDFLPADIVKASAKRDAALDALDTFEAEHAAALSDNWAALAEAEDIRAAVDAMAEGAKPADVLALPSKVDEVRAQRPKLLAISRKLAADVRAAETELKRRYDAVAGDLLPDAHKRLEDAVTAAEDAYRVFQGARDAAGMAMGQILHLRDRVNGGRSSAPFAGSVQRADGRELMATGPMESLREAHKTYADGFKPNPLVDVIGSSGVVLTLPLDQARALVNSAGNDARYVDPALVASLLAEGEPAND
ncbi:hypothetical protein ACF1A5_13355 [Streptomyces sp. NPDC014864]|uniref:hypothetical protein n=1 Tax=Streptomyces sp. NPDC014864 TaxID=3364924 RepID=UPI0036F5A8D2